MLNNISGNTLICPVLELYNLFTTDVQVPSLDSCHSIKTYTLVRVGLDSTVTVSNAVIKAALRSEVM